MYTKTSFWGSLRELCKIYFEFEYVWGRWRKCADFVHGRLLEREREREREREKNSSASQQTVAIHASKKSVELKERKFGRETASQESTRTFSQAWVKQCGRTDTSRQWQESERERERVCRWQGESQITFRHGYGACACDHGDGVRLAHLQVLASDEIDHRWRDAFRPFDLPLPFSELLPAASLSLCFLPLRFSCLDARVAPCVPCDRRNPLVQAGCETALKSGTEKAKKKERKLRLFTCTSCSPHNSVAKIKAQYSFVGKRRGEMPIDSKERLLTYYLFHQRRSCWRP